MTTCKRRQTTVELTTITILGQQIIPPTVIFKCKYDSTAAIVIPVPKIQKEYIMKVISITTDEDLIIDFVANDSGIFKPTLTFNNDKCTLPLLLSKKDIFEILALLDQTMTNITKRDFEAIKEKYTGYFKLMGAIEEFVTNKKVTCHEITINLDELK